MDALQVVTILLRQLLQSRAALAAENLRRVEGDATERSGVALGSPRDPTRPCVREGVALNPRNPWWAVRDSNPGPSG